MKGVDFKKCRISKAHEHCQNEARTCWRQVYGSVAEQSARTKTGIFYFSISFYLKHSFHLLLPWWDLQKGLVSAACVEQGEKTNATWKAGPCLQWPRDAAVCSCAALSTPTERGEHCSTLFT